MSKELDVPTRVAGCLFFIGAGLFFGGLPNHDLLLQRIGGSGIVAGIVVFVIGWALRRRKRKE
jgi:uncharacterized membrane protein YgdD (TMEM256/DUF423 family)